MNDKRKRAPPTIDLSATELPAAGETDTPPSAAADSTQDNPTTNEAPSTDEEQLGSGPPEEPTQPTPGTGRQLMMAVGGGIVGAAVICGAVAALWYMNLFPSRPAAPANQSQQIEALQQQVQNLQARPAADDSQTVDALRQRLGKLEKDIAQLPPGDKTVAEQLAAVDNAMKSLGIALAALNKRSDDVAAKADQAQGVAAGNEKTLNELRERVQSASRAASALEPGALDTLQKRVAALEQSLAAARTQVAQTAASEQSVRLALSAQVLREAVERGVPFASELAQARMLGANPATLTPLEPFAPSGLPGKTDLARQLSDLLPAMTKAAGAEATPGGFFERLQANAGKLVRVQPVGAPPGDDAADVMARLETHAAHADIDAALADIAKLPEAARREADPWTAKATARQKALAAAQRLVAEAASGLDPSTRASPAEKP